MKRENPVKVFLESLQKPQKAKIFRIFQYIEFYGLSSVLPHVKKLAGTPFWEIRILGQDNIRILYISFHQNAILLLHGFIKKKQKTPPKEIDIALQRFNEYKK
jgi:phage-related protein